jgi:tyrosyl-tRNA synthetase
MSISDCYSESNVYRSDLCDFLHESKERGFIHQCTNMEGLNSTLKKGRLLGYVGFDVTARSLHVGNLVSIMWCRLFQKMGHKALILLGDATTLVGDPSGKDKTRQLLDEEDIAINIKSIESVFQRFLNLDHDEILFNGSWLSSLNYLDFLRVFGSHFSVNRMLSFESVKLRLEREQSLTFLEFNYMLLQAYDFFHLFREYRCVLQFGGSDQWGNIINGVDLIRKIFKKEAFGLTSPLVTTANGSKMGKTEQGAVWLNADLFSPFDYWQFWRNTHDLDVVKYLKLFTELPLSEIKRLEVLKDEEINSAKIILANEATKLAHGAEVLDGIHKSAETLFAREKQLSSSINLMDSDILSIDISYQELPVRLDELFLKVHLMTSKSEFKRHVEGKAIRLNDQLIEDPFFIIDDAFLKNVLSRDLLKLSLGKKKHALVKIKD